MQTDCCEQAVQKRGIPNDAVGVSSGHRMNVVSAGFEKLRALSGVPVWTQSIGESAEALRAVHRLRHIPPSFPSRLLPSSHECRLFVAVVPVDTGTPTSPVKLMPSRGASKMSAATVEHLPTLNGNGFTSIANSHNGAASLYSSQNGAYVPFKERRSFGE